MKVVFILEEKFRKFYWLFRATQNNRWLFEKVLRDLR